MHSSALKTEGFSVTTTQVLAVEINDRPGGLSEAMKALYNDNISVEYMYSAFINTKENTAYLILRVENVTAALEALSEAGFALTVSLGDSSYWKCVHASAAADALITNLISHFHRPPCINSTSIISNTILI